LTKNSRSTGHSRKRGRAVDLPIDRRGATTDLKEKGQRRKGTKKEWARITPFHSYKPSPKKDAQIKKNSVEKGVQPTSIRRKSGKKETGNVKEVPGSW